VSGFDACLGRSYSEIGLEARSMHKCQGRSQLLLLPGQPQRRTYRLKDSLADVETSNPDGTKLWHAHPEFFTNIDTSIEGLTRFSGDHPRELTDGLAVCAAGIRDARSAAKTSASSAVAPLAAGRGAVRDLDAKLPAILTPSRP